ncbi:MAG: TonB family protein [Methylococcaceae bacterium]
MNTPQIAEHSEIKSASDRLLVAAFLALIFHVVVIMGISFSFPQPQKINKLLDITLVTMPSEQKPTDASFLAQQNQIGGGIVKKKAQEATTILPNQSHSTAQQQQKDFQKTNNQANKTLTQQNAKVRVNVGKAATAITQKDVASVSREMLAQQVAQLGLKVRQRKQGSEQSRMKSIDQVSAQRYLASSYIEECNRKIERLGTLNFPDIALHANLTDKKGPRIRVGINPDGSIYTIELSKSSGNKGLDDAAVRIVRLAAPFPPIPMKLLEELDILILDRVWIFSKKSGLTSN